MLSNDVMNSSSSAVTPIELRVNRDSHMRVNRGTHIRVNRGTHTNATTLLSSSGGVRWDPRQDPRQDLRQDPRQDPHQDPRQDPTCR